MHAVLLLIAIALLAGCAEGGPDGPGSVAAPSDRVRREAHLVAGHDRPELPCLEAGPSDDRPVLTMGDTFFAPSCVVLRGRVDLRLVNRGALTHSFGVRAAGVSVDVDPGTGRVVSVEGLRGSGPVQLFCRFHSSAGMTGTITVL